MLTRESSRVPARRRTRGGVTLLELVVAIVVGGVVLALVASICVRQQRIYADVAGAAAMSAQLRDAAAVLPIDLRAAASGAGDIREARDTSIELRGTIASAVICDTVAGNLVLAPAIAGAETFSSFLTSVAAGDTAWVFAAGDSANAWQAFRVAASGGVAAGVCASIGPALSDVARGAPRVAIRLDASPSGASLIGTIVRITRPLRYSLYRGSDDLWYLGERDWNNESLRFNPIQPVSGPYLSAAGGGLTFQFLDSAGALLATPVADTRGISLVQIELRAEAKTATRVLSAAGAVAHRSDSLSLVVLLRNRR